MNRPPFRVPALAGQPGSWPVSRSAGESGPQGSWPPCASHSFASIPLPSWTVPLALLVALLALSQASFGADTNAPAAPQLLTLTFLHINDVHGQMTSFPLAGKDGGGYARLATRVRQFRDQAKPSHFFLVHAGDEFSVKRDGPQTLGTALTLATHGAANIAAMNALGFDCWVPGNGEFYGGLSNLQMRLLASHFSVLTANVTQRGDGQTLGQPFVLKQAGPIKVALLGLTWIRPETLKFMPLTLSDPVMTARKLVPELRRQADLVVAITHLGLAEDTRLAAAVEGLDLILGGHSHTVLPKGSWATAPSGRKVLICQAGEYLRRLGIVDMTLTRTNGQWRIADQAARLVSLDDTVKPDEHITPLIDTLAQEWGVKPPPTPKVQPPAK